MLTPKQWDDLAYDLGKEKITSRQFKNQVAAQIRAHLETLAPGVTLSSTELIDTLYPRAEAEKSLRSDIARQEISHALMALAVNVLQDCCQKGEVNGKFMGKPKRPWIWFRPVERETCCLCGQLLPLKAE